MAERDKERAAGDNLALLGIGSGAPIDRALAQRWLEHYQGVYRRTPSQTVQAKGAIAALINLMRGYEPPTQE